MMHRDFRAKLAKKGPLLGMQCFSGTAALVEILGHAGFDWVSLDMEHAPSDFERIEHLVMAANAAGVTPLVRVAENLPLLIAKALDTGAAGVIVPHVSSRSDLEQAVASTRYPPAGIRSACTSVRGTRYGDVVWTDYVRRVGEEVVVVPLVEDKEGIEAFDQLLAVKDVPVYWLGVSDLGQSLGLPGANLRHPELAPLAKSLCSRAAAAGKDLMCTVSPTITVEYAQYLMSLGFRLISYGADVRVFLTAVKEIATSLRPAKG